MKLFILSILQSNWVNGEVDYKSKQFDDEQQGFLKHQLQAEGLSFALLDTWP